MLVSFRFCSIGVSLGFEPARPDLEIISRVYFLCAVRIPSFNLSNSIPRKYLSSPSASSSLPPTAPDAAPSWKPCFRNTPSFSRQVLFQSEILGVGYLPSTALSPLRLFFEAKEQKLEHNDEFVVSYVDTLLNLALPEENRNLNHGENVSLCSEFLSVRTDTMSTFLEWVMANLVKKPSIQEKLYQEIARVVGDNQFTEEVVKEEDLQKMPYLKALVLEGPRRHPPSHFVLPWGRMR
ncbi:hypothetical protein CQW23_07920 [Capsicum baccatum]|uniref:Uncharacterized protein n=1 Tax=Capsicum baccatum TaxID=33114 RepID=A0A2G2X7H5_CAPBA|nr:hypothetical protein CQW23_07920 [Capsicum baccatum]